MRVNSLRNWTCVVMLMLCARPAGAVTDAEKCEAAKLKIAGKLSFCLLNADAKAVKTGDPADYNNCLSKYSLKWGTAETRGGGMCPTSADETALAEQIFGDAEFIALKLNGVRFVGLPNGTVMDTRTGLTWEMKDDLGGIHDKDNLYTWSATPPAPNGTAFTTFLATLNNNTSADGFSSGGCFAGYCDWRMPTLRELQTILLELYPCGTSPCIDPIFGDPQPALYWTATTYTSIPSLAWIVFTGDGDLYNDSKVLGFRVRAVRGGS